MRKSWAVLAALVTLSVTGCGYNDFQRLDESATAAWSEVVNNYQRRADLVPNLVAAVKGATDFEKSTLDAVVSARASVGQLKVTPEMLNDPQAFENFQKAQSGLTGALSRLLVVSENYPQLKATQQFSELAAQLEGTENRIAVARGRYIKAVQEYNVLARQFPNNLTAMIFGYKPKPNFTVENEKEIAKPPKVDFAPTPAKPQGEAKGAAK